MPGRERGEAHRELQRREGAAAFLSVNSRSGEST